MRSVFIRIQMLKHLRGKKVEMILKTFKIFVFLMNIIICTTCVVANDEVSYKEIIDDQPVATDFDLYFNALEKAIDFCLRHKHYVDINMRFGLFLMDVNLRQFLKQKRSGIPAEILLLLENLFVKNYKLVEYFQSMIQTHRHVNENVERMTLNIQMSQLFHNTNPSDKFNNNLLKQTMIYTQEELNNIYGNWEDYTRSALDYEAAEPTPTKSNGCLAIMAPLFDLNSNRNRTNESKPNCLMPHYCKRLVDNGSEFGYGLTHRLLFLVIARFSRGCVLFSEKEDQFKAELICKKCFNEAEYIALNSFQLPDLMFEQTCLCGLFGHTQFMRNSWHKTLLEFQNLEGCFSQKLATADLDENYLREDENEEWKIERDLDIMDGQCNVHVTSAAVASLSNVLRYIIETYYIN